MYFILVKLIMKFYIYIYQYVISMQMESHHALISDISRRSINITITWLLWVRCYPIMINYYTVSWTYFLLYNPYYVMPLLFSMVSVDHVTVSMWISLLFCHSYFYPKCFLARADKSQIFLNSWCATILGSYTLVHMGVVWGPRVPLDSHSLEVLPKSLSKCLWCWHSWIWH